MGFSGSAPEKTEIAQPPLKGGQTMFEGMPREDIEAWLNLDKHWGHLSKDSIKNILDTLYGNDYMLDIFMKVTANDNIIKGINNVSKGVRKNKEALRNVFFRTNFAKYLDLIAEHYTETISKAFSDRVDPATMKETAFLATCSTELAIFVQPDYLKVYRTAAWLEWLLNKNESAIALCDKGIRQIDEVLSDPAAFNKFGATLAPLKNSFEKIKNDIKDGREPVFFHP